MGVLDGKAAIVTGSARGIGRATAELLAEQGAKVLINDLDGDVAEQAAGEIKGDTAVFGGDLTKGDAPDKLIQTAIDSFGKIDSMPQHDLDTVLWKSVHGADSAPPPPGPNAAGEHEEDDD